MPVEEAEAEAAPPLAQSGMQSGMQSPKDDREAEAAPPLAPPLSRRERFEGESDSQGGASLAASLPNPAWLPVTVPPSSPSATSTVSTETTVAV